MIQYVAQSDIAMLLFIVALITLVVVRLIFARLGLYSVAKRRGLRHPWLAWLPLGNQYMLGKISDQYQEKVQGRRTHRCWVVTLLGSLSWIGQLVTAFLILLMLLSVLIMVFAAVFSLGLIFLNNSLEDLFGDLLEPFIAMCIIGIASAGGTILRYMALYDLYRSCNPGAAKVFLIMSIIFSVAEPFFIFSCRNMDEGMPSALRIPLQVYDLPTEP